MTYQEFENARIIYATKYKEERKKAFCIIGVIIALIIIISLATDSQVPFFFPPYSIFIIFFIIASFAVISFKTRKEATAYKKAYKAYFVASSLEKIFTDIQYHHEFGLTPDIYGQVMTTGDRRSSNDLIVAKYKNLSFTQADVHTEAEHTDDDGNTTYSTIFKGRFLIFDFNRNFSTNIVVHTKFFPGAILPRTNNHKFQKIKTESTNFNKKFKFYAQDGIDALYVFDPSFMEKVQNLHESCKKGLLLTFMDKKLYIAINDYNDSFEPPRKFTVPVDEKAELEKVEKDIRVITNFVDSLDLDRYCGETKK